MIKILIIIDNDNNSDYHLRFHYHYPQERVLYETVTSFKVNYFI